MGKKSNKLITLICNDAYLFSLQWIQMMRFFNWIYLDSISTELMINCLHFYLTECKTCSHKYLWMLVSPDMFSKKCVLRNFAKFTGKHLCQSIFFSNYCQNRFQFFDHIENRLNPSWNKGWYEVNFIKNSFFGFLLEQCEKIGIKSSVS